MEIKDIGPWGHVTLVPLGSADADLKGKLLQLPKRSEYHWVKHSLMNCIQVYWSQNTFVHSANLVDVFLFLQPGNEIVRR